MDKYQDNLTSGCSPAFQGGLDAGNNNNRGDHIACRAEGEAPTL